MIPDLRALSRALGGEVAGGQVLCPGPDHRPRDRSLSVRLSASAPDGFVVHSHAGDPWDLCRDHVKQALGLPRDGWKTEHPPRPQPRAPVPVAPPPENSRRDKGAAGLRLWDTSAEPCVLLERYLASRGLNLEDDIAGCVLRWNNDIAEQAELFGPIARSPSLGAMVTLFRSIATDEPRAISCTFLDREAGKIDRRFLGPVGGCAVKLDADENVLGGLHIGEGIETCMAARQLGLKPCWALGSKGAIGNFPLLAGVECLTLLAEPDAEREIEQCAERWDAAGKEVFINEPIEAKDLNDALKLRRAQPWQP